jgi:hypothetical protein
MTMAKKAGRPSGGKQDRPFQMRVSEEFLELVDEWRRVQPDLPSRSEAIRRIVVAEAQKKARAR